MKLTQLLEAKVRSVLSEMGQQKDEITWFTCNDLKLESLLGSPKRVQMEFNCANNPGLTSLEHCPESVDALGYEMNCNKCSLTSLKHIPKTVYTLECDYNPLTSLEGAPSIITSDFCCIGTKLTSLKGIHHQIKHIGSDAIFSRDRPPYDFYQITSHVLGLMKIEGLQRVTLHNKTVTEIINRHLQGNINGSNLEACHDELCENNFEAYAQL